MYILRPWNVMYVYNSWKFAITDFTKKNIDFKTIFFFWQLNLSWSMDSLNGKKKLFSLIF